MFALSSTLLSKSHSYLIHTFACLLICNISPTFLLARDWYVEKVFTDLTPHFFSMSFFLTASSLLFPLVFEQICYWKCLLHEPHCSLVWWIRVAFSHQFAEEHEGSSNPSAECGLFLYSLSLLLYAACSRINFSPIQCSIKTRPAITALTFSCINGAHWL